MGYNRLMRRIIVLFIVSLTSVAYVILSKHGLNAFEAQFIHILQAETGLELKVDAKMQFKIAFMPTLILAAVMAQNAPKGSMREMVTIKEVELQFALLPLFRKKLQVQRLVLVEPNILAYWQNLNFG